MRLLTKYAVGGNAFKRFDLFKQKAAMNTVEALEIQVGQDRGHPQMG